MFLVVSYVTRMKHEREWTPLLSPYSSIGKSLVSFPFLPKISPRFPTTRNERKSPHFATVQIYGHRIKFVL